MAEPIPMRMNDANALRWLRRIAEDSARVVMLPHASQRMVQRKVTLPMVIECLRQGTISEPVAPDREGYWKLTVEKRVAGKDVRVAASIDIPSRVIVITVF